MVLPVMACPHPRSGSHLSPMSGGRQIWRSVSDQIGRVYYFNSATRPDSFWVPLSNLDLQQAADGEVYSGDVSAQFRPATPFTFEAVAP